MMVRCKCMAVSVVLALIGVIGFIAGFLALFLFPPIFRKQVDENLVLTNSSKSLPAWEDPPAPIYLSLYLFNVTNPDAVSKNTEKPALQQHGPYVFRERRVKVDITWNNNHTVSYKEIRTWHFNAELSNGTLKDQIISLNVPLVTAAALLLHKNRLVQLLAAFLFRKEKLFPVHTASELLFDGYDSYVIDMGKKLGFFTFPYDKFGWFYGLNSTNDGVYTVHTGEDDSRKTFIINKWKGSSTVPQWKSPCNVVNGTVGEMWPGKIASETPFVEMFTSDLCRSFSLDWVGEVTELEMRGFKFAPTKMMFANSTVNPDNSCFETGEIPPNGIANATECKFGAPAFVSMPHFYLADPSCVAAVSGLSPDENLHSTHVTLEPMTGMPLSVDAKFQINVLLKQATYLPVLRNVRKVYFPLVWFGESAILDKNDASQLKWMLHTLPDLVNGAGYALITLGVLCILALIAYIVIVRRRADDDDELLIPSSISKREDTDDELLIPAPEGKEAVSSVSVRA